MSGNMDIPDEIVNGGPSMEIVDKLVSVRNREAFAAKHMPDLGHDVKDFKVFTWRLSSWNKLQKKLNSPEFDCGGHRWRILLFPYGNFDAPPRDTLSVYLEYADPDQAPDGWHVCAQFALVISNPHDPTIYTVNYAHHRFISEECDWGFACFSKLHKLFKAQKGHPRSTIEDESAEVTVYVRVLKDPTGVLWHNLLNYNPKETAASTRKGPETSSKMHRCLRIPEIVSHIFSLYYKDCGSKKSLVTLAVTCKVFKDLALDMLWSEIDGIEPFIKCLPRDLWKETRDAGFRKRLSFLRPLQQADLDILRIYARRVRRFTWNQRGTLRLKKYIEPEGYLVFSLIPSYPPLLPEIKRVTLSVNCGFDFSLPLTRLMFGPKITYLELNTRPGDTTLPQLSIFMTLAGTCPLLETLILDVGSSSLTVGTISEAVCQWNHLKTLKASFLPNKKAMRHLASINCLVSLTLVVNTLQESIHYDFDDGARFWPVQKLDLSSNTEGSLACSTFLRSLQLIPRLISINTDQDDIRLSLSAIGDKCEERVLLEQIHISSTCDSDENFSLENLRPVFPFRHIVEVHVSCIEVILDNSILQEMAEAWPNLRILVLPTGSTGFQSGLNEITMDGFIKFIELCPKILRLEIEFDARTAVLTDERPGRGIVNPEIRELEFGGSLIEDSQTVSAIFSDLFPNLRTIAASTMFDSVNIKKHQKIWGEVESLLGTFARVRAQERNWRLSDGSKS